MTSQGPLSEPTFGGSHSMRENYEQGVGAYYQQHGSTYRNPHFPGIISATSGILDVWYDRHFHHKVQRHQRARSGCAYPGTGHTSRAPQCEGDSANEASPLPQRTKDGKAPAKSCTPCCSSYAAGSCVRCLDLAAGSGEATQAVEMWWDSRNVEEAGERVLVPPSPPRPGHATQPTAAAAEQQAALKTNEQAAALPAPGSKANENLQGRGDPGPAQLELPSTHAPAAASRRRLQLCIDAADPFTGAAYLARTGRQAQAYSFEDVGSGLLLDEGRSYHLCICSYAMHCCDDSFLYSTLQQLSLVCEALVIISPHKQPRVEERTGWVCIEHLVIERIHARLFLSQSLQCSNDLEVV
ncbi:hypothetical protein DUNSADRAFT_4481 [Dunaliella salina]|uniref:Uncharacterized protein n=1 Tax=Dunaliella salina TaxID=3046 RepID=A0ABQ7GS35_DUNSA|nr:hypothetical protein DUNSADRAFT_4481 [Dunaliella salina]|eukprot:KAF5837377.1 hypothetical protein DUNSADRAFT_4481 [Dunaliella salina]